MGFLEPTHAIEALRCSFIAQSVVIVVDLLDTDPTPDQWEALARSGACTVALGGAVALSTGSALGKSGGRSRRANPTP